MPFLRRTCVVLFHLSEVCMLRSKTCRCCFLLMSKQVCQAFHTAVSHASWYKKETACDEGLLSKRVDEEQDPGFCALLFPATLSRAQWRVPAEHYRHNFRFSLSHCRNEDKNQKNSVFLILTIKCLSLKVSFSLSLFLK